MFIEIPDTISLLVFGYFMEYTSFAKVFFFWIVSLLLVSLFAQCSSSCSKNCAFLDVVCIMSLILYTAHISLFNSYRCVALWYIVISVSFEISNPVGAWSVLFILYFLPLSFISTLFPILSFNSRFQIEQQLRFFFFLQFLLISLIWSICFLRENYIM